MYELFWDEIQILKKLRGNAMRIVSYADEFIADLRRLRGFTQINRLLRY